MSTSSFNANEIELRRQLLREELATLEDQKLKSLGSMQIIDFHHPERSPGWPQYRYQEFPKMLYHATQKDPTVEARRMGVRRRNEANPHLAPMEIPPSEPVMKKVKNAQEEAEALAGGFVKNAPERPSIDANSPLEVIGRASVNPLSAPTVSLSAAEIIELNAMSKPELVKRAREIYGVALPEEASKLDIIEAIQNGLRNE